MPISWKTCFFFLRLFLLCNVFGTKQIERTRQNTPVRGSKTALATGDDPQYQLVDQFVGTFDLLCRPFLLSCCCCCCRNFDRENLMRFHFYVTNAESWGVGQWAEEISSTLLSDSPDSTGRFCNLSVSSSEGRHNQMAAVVHLQLAPGGATLGLTSSFRGMKVDKLNVRVPQASGVAAPSLMITRCTATVPTSVSSKAATTDDGRVFNFAAGPATLPANVVKQAQADLYNWRGSGMSIMEVSHRGKEFLSIIQKAEADLRALLKIPDDYEVLFLQGGASTQFSAIPLNLATPENSADYIVSGSWGDKAYKEAQKYCKANLAWTGKPGKYTSLPSESDINFTPEAKYVHICANETIHGVEFKEYPNVGDAILIADMSSNFCSKPVDVSKFGIIYGGVQKNIGPAGVTIVIIKKELIGTVQPQTPTMLEYKIHADNKSLYNTPPCFSIYICGLVFEDLLAQGGLEAAEKRNTEKAKILYDAIDESGGFYKCPVERSVRSLMNVPFTMATPELEAEFIKEAGAQGMVQLKGHRSVGGVRASIYNAMPKAGVEKLVTHMKAFQAKHSS